MRRKNRNKLMQNISHKYYNPNMKQQDYVDFHKKSQSCLEAKCCLQSTHKSSSNS